MVEPDTTNGEPSGNTREAFLTEPVGEADVRIDVTEDTYQQLHTEYIRAVEHGYTEGFDTFAYNRCSTDCYVTVDGEPVDPDAEE